ncbi:Transcription activator of gluconeogenesis [Dirofilaria immitis]
MISRFLKLSCFAGINCDSHRKGSNSAVCCSNPTSDLSAKKCSKCKEVMKPRSRSLILRHFNELQKVYQYLYNVHKIRNFF